jgi:hypothetical protein
VGVKLADAALFQNKPERGGDLGGQIGEAAGARGVVTDGANRGVGLGHPGAETGQRGIETLAAGKAQGGIGGRVGEWKGEVHPRVFAICLLGLSAKIHEGPAGYNLYSGVGGGGADELVALQGSGPSLPVLVVPDDFAHATQPYLADASPSGEADQVLDRLPHIHRDLLRRKQHTAGTHVSGLPGQQDGARTSPDEFYRQPQLITF